MCLAIPGKVVAIDQEKGTAVIDYEAEQRTVGIALLPDIALGEYVLVQARMAVERVPSDEAQKFLDTLRKSD